MTRLESAVGDNNTLRELQVDSYLYSPVPVPASVAEAMLKGAARNKKPKKMTMTVSDTAELHKLVDEVKKVNKKLRLDVEYCKVRVSLCLLYLLLLFVCIECDGI